MSPEITISDIRLNLKEGGKSGRWVHPEAAEPTMMTSQPLNGVRIAILNIEDRQTALAEQPLLKELRALGAELTCHLRVIREAKEISGALTKAIEEFKSHVVLIVGGSGIESRDCVPEVLLELGLRSMPRLSSALGLNDTSTSGLALLNRAEVGVLGRALIVPLINEAQALHLAAHSFVQVLPSVMRDLRATT